MIVAVTGNKYQVGCGRGFGIEIPDLEFKLNCIIDPYRSTWPSPVDTRSQEEIDAGVPGPEVVRELKEGDIFLFQGTLLAVDHDRLVSIVSETGPLAIKRIVEDIITSEMDFLVLEDEDNEYAWDDDLKELPKEDLSIYTPKYEWMEIWHENLFEGRNLRKDPVIRVTLTDKILGEARTVYMTNWNIYYRGEEFDGEEIKWYTRHIMCYFYSEVGRTIPE